MVVKICITYKQDCRCGVWRYRPLATTAPAATSTYKQVTAFEDREQNTTREEDFKRYALRAEAHASAESATTDANARDAAVAAAAETASSSSVPTPATPSNASAAGGEAPNLGTSYPVLCRSQTSPPVPSHS